MSNQEFHWTSPLGISVVLFLASGLLHLLIGIVTPFAVDSEFSRRILMISNRTDTAFFGTEPTALLSKTPEMAKLRMLLSPVIGGWLMTIGILTISLTWFGLRDQQAWSLFTLAGCELILSFFWFLTIRQYLQAGVHIQFADIPPIFWIPAVTLIPAVILGWIGLEQRHVKIPSAYLLIASASTLGAGGIILLFVPELLGNLVDGDSALGHVVPQMLAAAWLGLASLNWYSRTTMIGGIYGRPLVLANFANFFIAATSIVRSGLENTLPTGFWIVDVVAALFAIAFGLRIYGIPPEHSSPPKE